MAALARAGDALRRHARTVRAIQWTVVAGYGVLVAVPAFLPLPDDRARILDDLTMFAQFVFWGLWWPFVLVSMVLFGRLWCGVFCPEGALSEAASRHGRGRGIPGWVRWQGWPFAAFALTTVYGQLVSVYQYAQAALLVLGGSTLAAIAVGWLYGRGKRVWCRHLCPVSGVFGLLARLAPLHFGVDEVAWVAGRGTTAPVNCAPLIDIRRMRGASACHACGRCSGQRGAVALSMRAPSHEIVVVGAQAGKAWDTVLLLFGLMGIAIGAFHWSASPWFIELKGAVATWAVERGWDWLLGDGAPWWLLTHYPENNDVFTWLDGGLIVAYILATAAVLGSLVLACTWGGARALGRGVLHHLALAYVPLGGCGMFIGLSAITASLLRPEGVPLGELDEARTLLLAGATLWSLGLARGIARRYPVSGARRAAAVLAVVAGTVPVLYAWALLLWLW